MSILDLLIQNARIEGNLDTGIVDMKANVIELQGTPKVLYQIDFCCDYFFNASYVVIWRVEKTFIVVQIVYIDQVTGASTVLFTFILDRGTTWEVILFFV